jgi:hypothetical protein
VIVHRQPLQAVLTAPRSALKWHFFSPRSVFFLVVEEKKQWRRFRIIWF